MQHHKANEKKFLAANPWITGIQGAHAKGLGKETIHFGSNSGYQAINLAYLLGAKRIFLLGYDMTHKQGTKTHWFGDHPPEFGRGKYEAFIPFFNSLASDLSAAGVEVINCSRITKLTQFKRGTIDDFATS